jgi:hypothetical protein
MIIIGVGNDDALYGSGHRREVSGLAFCLPVL